jgi:hypothetical protein
LTELEVQQLLVSRTDTNRTYTVREGDTLKSIAMKLYGDLRAVEVISYYNNNITNDGLKPGLILGIPFVDHPTYVDVFDVYGTDFKLDQDGNLLISSTGDTEIVSGLSNIIDAISHRLDTQVGTYLRNIDYGRGFYIGAPQKSFILKMLKVKVVESILSDDRIQSVDSVTFNVNKTQVNIEINMSTVLYDSISFVKQLKTSF